jgi:hypothetical protein
MNVSDLEVRLDFLELGSDTDYNLYLALDLIPGGTYELPFDSKADLLWDVLIVDLVEGLPYAINPEQQMDGLGERLNLIPRIYRDYQKDILVVSLNTDILPEITTGYRLQAFLVTEGDVDGEVEIFDEIGPVRSDVKPPSKAPLVLAFWNTFPAHTPAQSLRRWSGAHTGPLGGRHGLKYLLNSASRYQIPIVLLDLKTSISLSALEYMGKLENIQENSASGLLILPDVLPDLFSQEIPAWATTEILKVNKRVPLNFNLNTSHFLYASWLPDLRVFSQKVIFLKQDIRPEGGIGPVEIYRWQDRLVLPLLVAESAEPVDIRSPESVAEGLSMDIRCAALRTALAHEEKERQVILVLGGNLSRSAWGDPDVADTALAYIAAHPWINPLRAMDIASFHPSRSWKESGLVDVQKPIDINQSAETADKDLRVLKELCRTPEGVIKDIAWQSYFALLAPATYSNPELLELRANYLGDIGSLLTAARWETNPGPILDCSIDTDWDGQPECVLATPTIFTLFEIDGARLLFAFANTPVGVQQIIAPSSQFAVGLSDYSIWDISRGVLADPEVVPGAFSGPWEPYQVELLESELTFISDSVRKTYTLLESELVVHITTNTPYEFIIPLAVSPQRRFQPEWGSLYVNSSNDQMFVWGIQSGPKVLISASEEVSSQMFTSSSTLLNYPEDPNRDYSAGHFLPYPLAIASIEGDGELEVVIQVIPRLGH